MERAFSSTFTIPVDRQHDDPAPMLIEPAAFLTLGWRIVSPHGSCVAIWGQPLVPPPPPPSWQACTTYFFSSAPGIPPSCYTIYVHVVAGPTGGQCIAV